MTPEPELDLALPPAPGCAPMRRGRFAGLSMVQLALGLVLVVAFVWAIWVTRSLAQRHEERFVSARVSAIVGDYVQAAARSSAPPTQVEAEMRRFMASLDRELQRRSSKGQIVLVGEAVLTKNVPDITESLARSVYASGVARPRPAAVGPLPPASAQGLTMPAPARGPVAPADPGAAGSSPPSPFGPAPQSDPARAGDAR